MMIKITYSLFHMLMKNTTLFTMLLVGVIFAGSLTLNDAYGAVFAKYDGIEGESKDKNHVNWIDVSSLDWGVSRESTTREGGPVIEDLIISMEYEKASPKLLEAAFSGNVIPKLKIELTSTYGGAKATYLEYEFKNVLVTSYKINASGNDAGPPTVVIGNSFEEIKVTYTEFDSEGKPKGNVETQYMVWTGRS